MGHQSTYAKPKSEACLERLRLVEVALVPGDVEEVIAAVAAHRVRVVDERRALAAAGADGVARAPARREAWRAWRGHDGPLQYGFAGQLQLPSRHRHRFPLHVQRGFHRRELENAIPRAAADRDRRVDLDAGPLKGGSGH